MGIVQGVEITSGANDPFAILVFNVNIEVQIAKCTLVVFGNPTFNNLQLEVYNMLDGVEKELLLTSEPVGRSVIVSQGWSNIPFVFYPTFTALQNNRFGFKVIANGYTYSDTDHIGWLVNSTPLYSNRHDLSIEIIGVQL